MQAVLTVILCAAALPAYADLLNGSDLRSSCLSDKTLVAGYVGGWADKQRIDRHIAYVESVIAPPETDRPWYESAQRTLGQVVARVCLRDDVTVDQLTDAVCNGFNKKPELGDLSAAKVIETVMPNAFPCSVGYMPPL